MTPILRTQRLLLRPLVAEDAGALTPLIADYEVSKWLTHAPHPYNLQDATSFLLSQTEAAGRVWAITSGETFLGVIGVQRELGYWLGRPHWRQGYMSEAARAVVQDWFDDSTNAELTSGHFLGNHGSRGVLSGLGFRDTHMETVASAARGADVQLQRMKLTRQMWEVKHG